LGRRPPGWPRTTRARWWACAPSSAGGSGDPDGTTINAVRAVDTATHPDWQGRGIFSRLTLGALDDLRDDGVDCVFNTPNDKSRPGYLKMGWQQVGKVPVSVRLTGPRFDRQVGGRPHRRREVVGGVLRGAPGR
jgi:GNAT superfamily N-acetyltransferase